MFLNSISIGCLSNVYGHEGEVFMTDARCVIGCEGGMVTVKDRRGYRYVLNMKWCLSQIVIYWILKFR